MFELADVIVDIDAAANRLRVSPIEDSRYSSSLQVPGTIQSPTGAATHKQNKLNKKQSRHTENCGS